MRTTNRDFALNNEEFRQACARAGIQPTQRQASKFRLRDGKAYACRNGHAIDKASEKEIHLSQD